MGDCPKLYSPDPVHFIMMILRLLSFVAPNAKRATRRLIAHTHLKSKNLFRKSTDPLVLVKIPKILIKMIFMLGFIAYKFLAT